jgi:hypothetical protein
MRLVDIEKLGALDDFLAGGAKAGTHTQLARPDRSGV